MVWTAGRRLVTPAGRWVTDEHLMLEVTQRGSTSGVMIGQNELMLRVVEMRGRRDTCLRHYYQHRQEQQ